MRSEKTEKASAPRRPRRQKAEEGSRNVVRSQESGVRREEVRLPSSLRFVVASRYAVARRRAKEELKGRDSRVNKSNRRAVAARPTELPI